MERYMLWYDIIIQAELKRSNKFLTSLNETYINEWLVTII